MSGAIELQVLDRLRPVSEMVAALPFKGKDATEFTKTRTLPRLARSASLDRIRQFPAYLCSQSTLPNALSFLKTSSTTVQAGLFFARDSLLVVGVYLTLLTLAVQLSALCCALMMAPKPPGLIFMVSCIFFMCFMASKTIVHEPAKQRTA